MAFNTACCYLVALANKTKPSWTFRDRFAIVASLSIAPPWQKLPPPSSNIPRMQIRHITQVSFGKMLQVYCIQRYAIIWWVIYRPARTLVGKEATKMATRDYVSLRQAPPTGSDHCLIERL